MRAMSFSGSLGSRSSASNDICTMRHYLQVCWINTEAIATQVVNLFILRNWTIEPRPRKAVSNRMLLDAGRGGMDIETPIPGATFASNPNPTGRAVPKRPFLVHLSPETLFRVFVFPPCHKLIIPQVTL